MKGWTKARGTAHRMDRAAAVALAIVLALAASAGAGAAEPVRVRVMAANITSGTQQSYPVPGPGERIFRALGPDVVLLQELNVEGGNDEAALRAFVDEVFGPDFHVAREPGGDQIPNGIVSRWPILEAGEWQDPEVGNRDFAFARIDLPGEVDLWAVSVHLLTRSAAARDAEARALVEAILERVPEGDYLTVGGDFNTDRRNEPALDTLARVVDVLPPFPDDGGDPPDEDTNAGRRKPYDWVLADGDFQAHRTATAVGGLTFADGLVFDSRIFDQDELDEHFPPVRRADSGAPQMQHMAVVRDFLVPVGEDGGGEDGDPDDDPDGEDGGEDGGGPAGEPIDLSGFRLRQADSDQEIVLPAGTALAPGGLLVVGRAAGRAEFEELWGPLAPGVVYLDGHALAGPVGFPVINGGETYRLLDAAGDPADPAAGRWPPAPLRKRTSVERRSTAAAESVERDELAATPGRFAGERAGTGRVVLTEASDAREFRFEFVELLFDAPDDPE